MLQLLLRALFKSPRWLVVTVIVVTISLVTITGTVAFRLANRIVRVEHDKWIIIFEEPVTKKFTLNRANKPQPAKPCGGSAKESRPGL